MDPALSDVLACPRCGPTYGLILLPEERQERRVVRGVLGCANCRERYRVEAGVADLRVGPPRVAGRSGGEPLAVGDSMWDVSGQEAVRLAGLLGLGEAAGPVLLAGPASAYAGAVGALSERVTVVAVEDGAPAFDPDVSRIRVSDVLPFQTGSLAGVALTGEWTRLLDEAVRVLAAGRRLLLEPVTDSPTGAGAEIEILAREHRTVVATRT